MSKVQPSILSRSGSTWPRQWYIGLALSTIALGLGVHGSDALAGAFRDKLGDALWAIMIVWGISALAPKTALPVRIGLALAVCVVVESSQLYHTEALDSARGTAMGRLVLGSGFDPLDLVAYTLGVLAAGLLEVVVARQIGRHRNTGERSP